MDHKLTDGLGQHPIRTNYDPSMVLGDFTRLSSCPADIQAEYPELSATCVSPPFFIIQLIKTLTPFVSSLNQRDQIVGRYDIAFVGVKQIKCWPVRSVQDGKYEIRIPRTKLCQKSDISI